MTSVARGRGVGGDPDPGPEFEEHAAAHRPSVLRNFRHSRTAMIGTVIIVVIALAAALAPVLTPYDPLAQSFAPLQGPTWAHPFGTDELGRDLASRVVHGARDALIVSLGAAALAGVIGVPVGIAAGYLGRWLDAVSMRLVDLLLAVPGILAALVIVTILGSGTVNLIIAIGLAHIPAFARLARASTLSIREREYVLASRGLGASSPDIMGRTVLPNVLGPLIVQFVIVASLAVIITAGLSFLGLGSPPPAPSWGAMLKVSRSYLFEDPWFGVFPGIALTATILGLDLIGRGLARALRTGDIAGPRADGGL